MKYLVTDEIFTPKWKRILRYFRLIKRRNEFFIVLKEDYFDVGSIIGCIPSGLVIILKRV
jgi:hypothetical protein